MTLLTHGTSTFALTHLVLPARWSEKTKLWASIVSGFLATLPDLIPSYQTYLQHNWNDLYVYWHDFSFWTFLPPIGGHQILDFLTHNHGAEGGINLWVYLPFEIVLAVVSVFYIAWLNGKAGRYVGYATLAIWIVGLIGVIV